MINKYETLVKFYISHPLALLDLVKQHEELLKKHYYVPDSVDFMDLEREITCYPKSKSKWKL